jgi:hypothetical protein
MRTWSAVLKKRGILFVYVLAFILKKMQRVSDVYHSDDFEKKSQGRIFYHVVIRRSLSVSTLISFRIPLYCNVDKLTNLTIHIRLSSVTRLSTGGT